MRAFAPRLAVIVLLSCVAVGCTTSEQESSTVVVGAGDDVRSELLAEIYAGAVRSTGASVRIESGLGDRSSYLQSLDRGEIDVVADLTGELLATFDSTSTATNAEDVFTDLNKSLPVGLSVTDFATAEDRRAVAVTPTGSLADAADVVDIAPRCGTSTVVVAEADVAALDTLDTRYGCVFGSVVTAPNEQTVADAVTGGSADVAVIRTASAGPAAKDLTVLTDSDEVFSAQNVVPLFRDGVLNDSEIRSFSVVAGELATADLADMIGEVRSGENSADVAARWLGEHNL